MDSIEYYNNIYNDYSSQSDKRMLYLNSIDQLIAKHCHQAPNAYLDVGCGDGRRTRKIAAAVKACHTVAIDTSKNMLPTEKGDNIVFRCAEVSDLNETETYDLVTILWNVLGHIPTFSEREKLLRDCSSYLTDKGQIILDLNNRYNALAYGIGNVFQNIILDLKSGESGWNKLKYHDSEHMVYIHNLNEVKLLARNSGLKITKIEFVNYDTGKVQNFPFLRTFMGQIYIVLEK